MLSGDPGMAIERISELVWVSDDGEFIREDYIRRLQRRGADGAEVQNLPRRFRRLVGETPQVPGAPSYCGPHDLYREYEAVKFNSVWAHGAGTTPIVRPRDVPEPITNRTIIRELVKLEKYAHPRCWPTLEFVVDGLLDFEPWQINPLAKAYGRRWCHLLSINGDESDLHWFAQGIGLNRTWFQKHPMMWHYDLTPAMRQKAVDAGAREVEMSDLHGIYLARKEQRS